MIKAINSIWKNLLFDIILGLALLILVGNNLIGRTEHLDFTLTDKLAFFIYFLLWLHVVILLVLTIINLAQRTFFKAFIFILTGAGLIFGLQFITLFGFISTFGGPPVDEGNRYNFQKSELCKQFDKNKIKEIIENLRLAIYDSQLDSNFIIKLDTSTLPNKISKIECGCRKIDSLIVVFRIWDAGHNTFELEMTNENGKWHYDSFTQEYFD